MESKTIDIKGEIYLITNKVNNKKYVGQTHSHFKNGTVYGYKNRFKRHISNANSTNCNNKSRALYSAIRKYGKENFDIELLETTDTNVLDNREKHYIKHYNTLCPNGYNLTEGGVDGKMCDATAQKISNSLKGHIVSNDTKKKISESLIGNKHPNWGKKHSAKTLGKMSLKQTGSNHPMFNKHHSIESKNKISLSGRKRGIDEQLPLYVNKYITKKHEGYRVIYFENDKKCTKSFTNKQLDMDKKKELAINFYNSKYNNTH